MLIDHITPIPHVVDKKKRIPELDIMKGVGILLVICLHTNTIPFDCLTKRLIYSFHLPLFFFVSGYFLKEKPIAKNLLHDATRLIIPFLITLIICAIINGFVIIPEKGFPEFIIVTLKMFAGVDVGAVWFLLALYICKNSYNIVCNISISDMLDALIIAILVIGYTILSYKHIILGTFPICIFPGIAAIPFYYVGVVYKNKLIPKSLTYILVLWYFVWSIYTQHTMVIAGGKYNIYVLDLLAGVGGTFGVLMICKMIVRISPLKRALSYIGRISLLILCVHSIQLSFGLRSLTDDAFMQISLMLIACLPVSMLLYKNRLVRKFF